MSDIDTEDDVTSASDESASDEVACGQTYPLGVISNPLEDSLDALTSKRGSIHQLDRSDSFGRYNAGTFAASLVCCWLVLTSVGAIVVALI